MSASQIQKYVLNRPFQPFRLVLDTGEQITVSRPQKALLSGPSVAVVGISRVKQGGMGIEKLRIVQLNRIARVESVEDPRV
jgi:hypothetical protein